MAPLWYYSMLSFAFIFTIKLFLQIQSRRLKNLPPGPPTLPIIGNLHNIKEPIHHTLANLSHKYGDIFSLWFGSKLVVVVSSASLVQECFTKNDVILANRPRSLAGKYIFYNYTALGFTPYGEHWRNLRRIITIDVLSNHRLNSFLSIRRDETKRLVQMLGQITIFDDFTKVKLRSRLIEMTFNNMMMMMSGKRYYGEDIESMNVDKAAQFKEIINEILSALETNNISDFLPMLRFLDFMKFENRLKRIAKRADAFYQGLIEEHRSGNHNTDTMIEHLLTLQKTQPEYYSDHMIKGLIQVMLVAGTDTSAVTIEWAMAELLNNPEVLNKVKDEIDIHVGKDHLIDEQDFSKLTYLQNVISETLRLHPPAPLLLPHYSSEDCTIGGYTVPQDTMVLPNAWLIQRDPKLWSDAISFKPERFEKEGEGDKVIAFGLGRRACPGENLARRMVGYTLALLVQCFEWKLENDEKLDMTEGSGLNMPKLIPFQAMCQPRPIFKDVMKY